jgi:menaquinone-dependent protoporphyrinogen IX oxidase
MDLFIVYEGQRGKTGKIAGMLAERATEAGFNATAVDVEEARLMDVTTADVLAIGCSAIVDTPFGGESTHQMATFVSELPDLRAMPVVVYCTYRFFPHTFADVTTRTAEILGELEAAVMRRGGTVVSSHAINRRHAVDGVAAIVSDLQRQHVV